MTDWQARALKMRKDGNTLAFIAAQVSRAFQIEPGAVLAFLTAQERAQQPHS